MGNEAKLKLNSSRKRVINLLAAGAVTMLILGYTADRLLDGAPLHQAVWLVAFGNMVQWCGYLATTLRDEMRQDQQEMRKELVATLRETIRTEVAQLLAPIDSKIEEIDADVHSYGDQREAAGIALAAKIVGQRGNTGGRHLNLVD
ncbi:hypothetical protein Cme02nite_38750 [Catellatospora methionotrophica]|uniref:Uncharacterized protein n=1 Tax=Catellatospora methionotrophica TaxID=121620 RepID=A0A8J3PGN8_9ACTN|nr:hypothetical protein [Catellatospora methionotrophica]GIG15543.1 hypothetical protein Cme02nite_38750 [Catellatospora methionotrophica]